MFAPCRTNQIFINQLGPCRWHSWKPTNQNLNKCLLKVKEKAKLTHYYGFHIQRLPDREWIYNHYGGPNKGRHYLRPSKAAKQYEHHNTREGNVMHMYHQRFKSPHNTITGITLWIWTSQWGVSDPNWGYNQMGPGLNGDRDSANRVMESWGMKTVNIDSRVAPRIGDLMPHKHKLYINNFPWFKDPITTQLHGDADFGWKGDDIFDYSSSSSSKNGVVVSDNGFGSSVMANTEAAVAAARSTTTATTGSTAAASTTAAPPKKAAASTASTSTTASTEEKKAPATPAAAATPAAETTTTKKSSSKKKSSSSKKESSTDAESDE